MCVRFHPLNDGAVRDLRCVRCRAAIAVCQLSVRFCGCEIVYLEITTEMRQRQCLRRIVLEERLAQICLVRRNAKVVVCLIHIVKLQFALGMRKPGV